MHIKFIQFRKGLNDRLFSMMILNDIISLNSQIYNLWIEWYDIYL